MQKNQFSVVTAKPVKQLLNLKIQTISLDGENITSWFQAVVFLSHVRLKTFSCTKYAQLYSCKVTQFPEIPRVFFFLISLTFSIWNTPR